MLIPSHSQNIEPMWKLPVSREFKSTDRSPTTVTHDFEIHASILGLSNEADADALKFNYDGEFWYARVTDVSFTSQKLECTKTGANYVLRGTVTFAVIDYYTEAKALAPCFITDLRFRDERVIHGFRSLGGHVTAL